MKPTFENPFIQLLSRLCDLILLQLAFLITSLPLFTVGAGLTALFAVSKKLREDSVTSVCNAYFTEFRANFKQGTALWLVIVLLFGITYADARFWAMGISYLAAVGQVFSYILMFAVFLMLLYTFPQVAWFRNSLRQYLKNSLLLALAHPGTTAKTVLFCIGAVLAAEFARPLFFMLGFSGTVYICTGIFEPIFFHKAEEKEKLP